MNTQKIELSNEDVQVLRLLGDSMSHIRGICSRRHCDSLSDKEKLELINKIAEASHNLPHVLAQGGSNSNIGFLMASVAELRVLIDKEEYAKKVQYKNSKEKAAIHSVFCLGSLAIGLVIAATLPPGEDVMPNRIYEYIQAFLYVVFMGGFLYHLYHSYMEYKTVKKLKTSIN